MSNPVGQYGLSPVRHKGGGTIRMVELPLKSEAVEAFYYGDPCYIDASGDLRLAAGTGLATCVFAGVAYVNEGGRPKFDRYILAGRSLEDVVAWGYNDPNIVYTSEITTVAEADIGKGALILPAVGNAKTGNSGASIDGSTIGATTPQVTIEALGGSPGNEYGANADVEVSLTGLVGAA